MFRPEFLNRIDEIVEFAPLTREQLGEVVELQLVRLRTRLAERGLQLELTPAATELVADAGWDPAYGARPLKRALRRLVENPTQPKPVPALAQAPAAALPPNGIVTRHCQPRGPGSDWPEREARRAESRLTHGRAKAQVVPRLART